MNSQSTLVSAEPNTSQNGVVVVIALIILMILSMVSIVTLRQAGSSTQISGNSRTQTMATQAADIALKICETRVNNFLTSAAGPRLNPRVPVSGDVLQRWEPVGNVMVNWDLAPSKAIDFPVTVPTNHYTAILTAADLNVPANTYRRYPECMAEYKINGLGNIIVITVRGFGPEVTAADQSRTPPNGTEIWLQSTITQSTSP
jgi:Tfp pilus assembly protein PilX